MSELHSTPRVSTRTFYACALVVCLLLAGVASYYASADPDGLEFVADRTGFLTSAEDSATAASPLADYEADGVDDARLSVGAAGVIGVALVLVLGGALFWALRGRGEDDPAPDERS